MTDHPGTNTPAGPRRLLVCGCCHLGGFPFAARLSRTGQELELATRRRRDRTPASAHGRHASVSPAREAPAATPAVRGYSPPPPAVSPVRGLIDFHTHAAPDVFGRAVSDEELAAFAAARQMEAVVFQNHVTATADRAWLARRHVGGVKIFGGIVLNGAVGGINARAVEWMWRMQGGHGRVVWFPTFDADNHVRRAGTAATGGARAAPSGIRVVDERGAALPAVREVLKVCAAQRLVVHTGHSSAEQAL